MLLLGALAILQTTPAVCLWSDFCNSERKITNLHSNGFKQLSSQTSDQYIRDFSPLCVTPADAYMVSIVSSEGKPFQVISYDSYWVFATYLLEDAMMFP